jgi:hypothetical protein
VPSITYGVGAFKRDTGNLPPLELVNMFVEEAKTSENQVCLQSRAGLATFATRGSGPIKKLYSEKGVFSGAVLAVSSSTLYKDATSLGTVNGSGPYSIAGTASEALIAGGGTLQRSTGAALANVSFPDSAAVRAVCVINFLFVAVRGDSTYPGRFYWSAVNNGNSWDALDYATAERAPDALLDIAALGDNIWLFGQSSLEVWQNTGAATLPFQRMEQVAFDKGIIATGAWAKADNSLIFIGSDAVVYRAAADNPVRISEHWLEEKIAASSAWSVFAYSRQGHEFVCIRLDSETYAYDVVTQEWTEFQTSGANWIAQCSCMVGSTAYLGHSSTGAVMTFSGWQDLGADLTRKFTAGVPLDGPLSINGIRFWLNVGAAPTGITPTLYLSYSRDQGRTYSTEISTDIGNATDDGSDDYRVRAEFRRLGMFDDPGAMFKVRYAAAGGLRVSAVKVNDNGGGRSRA